MTEPTPSEVKAEHTSLGDLLSEVTEDITTLVRQEIELAKAEVKQSAARAGKGAGMMSGAAYAASMMVLFVSIAGWWALGTLIGNGWSGLVVAALWGIIALVLFLLGRSQLKDVKGLPQTVDSIKKIPESLKRNEENQ